MQSLLKEWYTAMRQCHLTVGFEEDQRAAQVDEALFEEVFEWRAQEIRMWIEDFCSMSETPEELDKCPNHLQQLYEITGDETHKATAAAYEYYHQHPEVFREVMLLRLRDAMKRSRKFYPAEILDMVADERVFTCRVAAREVIEQMYRIEEESGRRMREISGKMRKREEALKEKFSEDIPKYFDFHDVQVKALRWEENNLIIELDEHCNAREVKEVRLHDCRIESMDEGIEGAYWLYDELYMTEDSRIGVCVMLEKESEAPYDDNAEDERIREMNLTVGDITFVREEGAQQREERWNLIHEELVRMGVDFSRPIDSWLHDEAVRRVNEKYGELEGMYIPTIEDMRNILNEALGRTKTPSKEK